MPTIETLMGLVVDVEYALAGKYRARVALYRDNQPLGIDVWVYTGRERLQVGVRLAVTMEPEA